MLASDLEYLLVEGTMVPDSDGTGGFWKGPWTPWRWIDDWNGPWHHVSYHFVWNIAWSLSTPLVQFVLFVYACFSLRWVTNVVGIVTPQEVTHCMKWYTARINRLVKLVDIFFIKDTTLNNNFSTQMTTRCRKPQNIVVFPLPLHSRVSRNIAKQWLLYHNLQGGIYWVVMRRVQQLTPQADGYAYVDDSNLF